jgi:aryl-alcohol dehydrogenase
MRAQAALLETPEGEFVLRDVELDEPRGDEILVRIAGVGLCHTDMLPRLMPAGTFPSPIILGHEGSGTVEAVGAGVRDLRVGDRVVLSFDSCGTCTHCLLGEPAYCHEFVAHNSTGVRIDGTTGASSRTGEPIAGRWFGQSSLATHALATTRNVVRLPDVDLPLHLMGPLGCGVQTGAASVLVAMGVRPGDTIAVFGVGAVGLSAVMAAALANAATIVGVDLHQSRRDLALELGATHVFDGADPDLVAKVKDASAGGVNYALETTGLPQVILSAIDSLHIRGVCGLVGVGTQSITIQPQALGHGRSVSYLLEGNAVPQVFIPRLIEHWRRGRFPFDRLIKTYALADVNRAEADSLAGRTVKPVLLPAPIAP